MIGSVWKHIKTGNLYIVIGECQMEAEWEPGVLYIRSDGNSERPIARNRSQFLDGRFQQIVIDPKAQ